MHPFDEMKAYIGFTDADSARLRVMLPHVEPHLDSVIDRFYDAVLASPRAMAVFEDLHQVERLKVSLARWAREFFEGPHDHAYYARRLVIGRVHVRVGLDRDLMFTAMHVFRRALVECYEREAGGEVDREGCWTIIKLSDLELAIMLHTYGETREQRHLEALRDLLIGHLPIVAVLVDEAGLVTAATGPLKRQYDGTVKPTDLAGCPYQEVLPPELLEAAAMDQRIARARETGHDVVVPRVDTEIDGRRGSYRVTVVPIEHPMARLLIYVEDLTDAIASEARARHHESLALLGTMAAAVAHEIRNPLAGMSGTIQVILNSMPGEDRRAPILGKVLQQIDRLAQLVTDLLQFSKPVAAHCRSVDLGQLAIRAAAECEAGGLGGASVAGEGTGHADEGLLHGALQNLVQNAWQAGATAVQITVSRGAVAVFDDGPGLPEGEEERVFEPFYTTRLRGTGLGLPNARRAVEAMGGTLRSRPSPLGGAGFELLLAPPPSKA